jgi:hypothetical protein
MMNHLLFDYFVKSVAVHTLAILLKSKCGSFKLNSHKDLSSKAIEATLFRGLYIYYIYLLFILFFLLSNKKNMASMAYGP